ncbi:uncharacterized protein LOC143197631 isoform X2 [Rhynchophorus ferrugineus]|uniref:uncharacterized protein LOC143197631 isoform X2 n=1 Tax=Rhynchophorus ferrugineus TaxID=354439 RepID=UPI003FCC5E53
MGKEHMKSSFDTESAEFSFICMKQNTGEYFKDLDLITKLLVPKPEANYQEGSINIEVLSENYNTEDICISDDKEDETKEDSNQPNLNDGFGFALRARKDFVNICSTFDEVFGIDPCEVSLPQRHKLRLQYEQDVGISNDQFYSAKSEQSTRNNFETIQTRQNIKVVCAPSNQKLKVPVCKKDFDEEASPNINNDLGIIKSKDNLKEVSMNLCTPEPVKIISRIERNAEKEMSPIIENTKESNETSSDDTHHENNSQINQNTMWLSAINS